MLRDLRTGILSLGLALSAAGVQAHEFWISPQGYEVSAGAPVVADLRIGQDFEGPSYGYFPGSTRRFELAAGGETAPVEGRVGDRPALNQPAAAPGLAVAVHVTDDKRLTYDTLDKFRAFLANKDALWVLEAHAARGLPESGFGELYSRHAKSLVAVGDGAGSDRALGLETEIVAEANPYTDALNGELPVRVLYQGAARAGAQVELFAKAPDGTVVVTKHRTDAEGRVRLPVSPGTEYLVDAVVLRAPSDDVAAARTVVWESLWASLTFKVPG